MGRSKPASIRFDPEKLELVKRREKLGSAQKAVDFLMDAYWWNNKLILAPAMNATAQTLPYVVPQAPKTPFEAYEYEIKNAGTLEELERTGILLEKDLTIMPADKLKLREIAKNKAKIFNF